MLLLMGRKCKYDLIFERASMFLCLLNRQRNAICLTRSLYIYLFILERRTVRIWESRLMAFNIVIWMLLYNLVMVYFINC